MPDQRAELNPRESMAFLAIWAHDFVEQLGGIQHGWSEDVVRQAVTTAEADLENIWAQQPSIPVIARTVIYGVLDQLWEGRDGRAP